MYYHKVCKSLGTYVRWSELFTGSMFSTRNMIVSKNGKSNLKLMMTHSSSMTSLQRSQFTQQRHDPPLRWWGHPAPSLHPEPPGVAEGGSGRAHVAPHQTWEYFNEKPSRVTDSIWWEMHIVTHNRLTTSIMAEPRVTDEGEYFSTQATSLDFVGTNFSLNLFLTVYAPAELSWWSGGAWGSHLTVPSFKFMANQSTKLQIFPW